ncbi:MAG: DUF1569 domain-containing protein [Bacteroidia bacterium]
MKSLFNQSDTKEIIDRINRLTPETKAQWGKMNVSQMLAHAQAPLHIATDKLKLKRGLIGILFGRIAKKQLMKPEPFKKNLPTAPEFVRKDERVFKAEKENLIDSINSFTKAGSSGITKEAHPFFGKMTAEEWDILQWKHLDHHLRQFGV